MIVELRVDPAAGERSILETLPAPLCVDHKLEHDALDTEGRRMFARRHGIDLGRHALVRWSRPSA